MKLRLAVCAFLFATLTGFATTKPAKLISGQEPIFPHQEQLWKRTKGEVELKFTIDAQGAVKDIQVLKATSDNFAREAVDAVTDWKFEPTEVDSKKVATTVVIPFKFAAPVGVSSARTSRPAPLDYARLEPNSR